MKFIKPWFRKEGLSYLLLLLVPLLLICIWFRSGYLIAGGEDGIFLYNPERMLAFSSSLWLDTSTGFNAFDFFPRHIFALLFLWSQQLHISPVAFQATLFYALMTTGMVSVYYLIKEVFNENKDKETIAVIGGIFYLLNPYSMSQIWDRGLYVQYFMFAALPLLLYIFIKALKSKNYLLSILFALVSLFFAPAFGLATNIIVLWSVVGMYAVYHIFTNGIKKTIVQSGVFLGATFIIWALINAWWFLPFINSLSSVYVTKTNPQDNIGTLQSLSQYFPFTSIVRLTQSFYFSSQSIYGFLYKYFWIQFISWLLPFFLFFSFTQLKKNKESCFFFFLLCVASFVSLGDNAPLGRLFLFFFKRISFLQSFRNPYEKYGIVLLLAYAPLFALGLTSIFAFIRKSRYLKRTPLFLLCFPVIFFTGFVYLIPMWSGAIMKEAGNVIGIQVPSYYDETRTWLKTHNSQGTRIFMFPLTGDGVLQDWGKTVYNGVDSSSYMFDQPVISYVIEVPNTLDLLYKMHSALTEENTTPLMSFLNVKYLIKRSDVTHGFVADGVSTPLNAYNKAADIGKFSIYAPKNQINLKEIESPSQAILASNLDDFFSHLEKDANFSHAYILKSQNADKDLNPSDFSGHNVILQTKKISNTRYWIKLNNTSAAAVLLKQSFNPQWKVVPIANTEVLKNNFFNNISLLHAPEISEKNHYVADGYANFWTVKGSKQYAVVFRPQLYADIGATISLVAVSLSLALSVLYVLRNHGKR